MRIRRARCKDYKRLKKLLRHLGAADQSDSDLQEHESIFLESLEVCAPLLLPILLLLMLLLLLILPLILLILRTILVLVLIPLRILLIIMLLLTILRMLLIIR